MKDAAAQTAADRRRRARPAAPPAQRRTAASQAGRGKAAARAKRPRAQSAAPLIRTARRRDEAVSLRARHPPAMADGSRAGAGAAARADGPAATMPVRRRWACCTSPTTTRDAAQEILDHLGAELPEVTDWSGTVGVGIASSNVEYFDEPALAVMLCALPPDQYRVFSGVAPLAVGDGMGFEPHTALVHADAGTPDVAELIAEMAQRTATGYLFGGLASSRTRGGAVRHRRQRQHQGPGRGRRRVSRRAVRRGFRRRHRAGLARDAGLPAGGGAAGDHGGRSQPDHRAGRRAGAGRAAARHRHFAGPAAGRDGGAARHAGGPDRGRRRCGGPHRQLRRRRGGAAHHRPGSRRATRWRWPTGSSRGCAWRSAGATRRRRGPT